LLQRENSRSVLSILSCVTPPHIGAGFPHQTGQQHNPLQVFAGHAQLRVGGVSFDQVTWLPRLTLVSGSPAVPEVGLIMPGSLRLVVGFPALFSLGKV